MSSKALFGMSTVLSYQGESLLVAEEPEITGTYFLPPIAMARERESEKSSFVLY